MTTQGMSGMQRSLEAQVDVPPGRTPAPPGLSSPDPGAPRNTEFEAASSAIARMRQLATWAAGLAALVLLGVVAARYSDFMTAMRGEADLVSPLVLGEQAHRYTGAYVMTGNYGWWPGLWVVQAVRGLPAGDVLGLRLPGAVSLVVVAALAAEARRLWGTLNGLIVVLVSLSVGASAMMFLVAWSGRAPTWWAMAALGLAAIHLVERSTGRRRIVTVIGAAFAVVLAAAVLSGDKLAWAVTVAPLVAVFGLGVFRRSRRLAVVSAAMALAVALGSLLIRALAESSGYLQQVFPVDWVPFSAYSGAVGNALTGLTLVWRGPSGNNMDYAAGYIGAMLAVTALIAGAAWIAREVMAPRDEDKAASDSSRPGLVASREIWMVFWVAALAAMMVAFCLSQVSTENGVPVPRYLFGVPFAASAVLAGLAHRRSGWWVAVPAVLLAFVAALASVRAPAPVAASARTGIAPEVARIAREHGITRGYASYWSAYPMQLASRHQLDMVPVGGCPNVEPYALCPMYLHYVDQAYQSREARKSFVLIDPAGSPPGPHSEWLTQLPPGMKPSRSIPVGEGVVMALFDWDVAGKFLPTDRVALPPGSGGPRVGPQ